MNQLPVLSGLPLEELTELLTSFRFAHTHVNMYMKKPPPMRMRAKQIFKWIASGASAFDTMDNLPLQLRKELVDHFSLRPKVIEEKHSGDDGTVKLVLQFSDGAKVEAVLLSGRSKKETMRYTACLSTQAGCPIGCVFCKTGSIGFRRNLNSAEIIEQLLLLQKYTCGSPIANIVVMGMGEPLLNLDELRRAIAVITDAGGLHLSRRRITVSTCGITEGIISLAENGPAVRLALSLVSADGELRRRIMPITANEPLAKVKEALAFYQARGGGRITLEIVLLSGINTGGADAQYIAQFAKGLDAVINLIPWNPVTGLSFEGRPLREPSPAETAAFKRSLETYGLNVTGRFRRGRSIMGACGQLGDK